MRSLVVGQLAASLVIVFAATLLGRTLINFMRIDPGFSTARLVIASFEPITSGYVADQMPALSQRLIDAVRGLPGVRSAATSMCGLFDGCSSSGGYKVEGAAERRHSATELGQPELLPDRRNSASRADGSSTSVTPGRAHKWRLSMKRSRGASSRDRIQSAAALDTGPLTPTPRISTSKSLAWFATRARRVSTTLPEPMAYFSIGQWGGNLRAGVTNLDIRVDGDPRAIVSTVRSAIREAEPNLFLFDVTTMSSRLARDLNRERIVAYLAFSFAVLTLLLAALGLYGVLSYGVAQRTQEIGVRIALGARRIEVMGSVLGQSARLTVTGIVLGLIATTAVAGYLSRLLFGVAPLDLSTFIVVLIIFAIVTMLASYLPARRATKVDPLIALRCE